jgi:hypothetical protein
MISRKREETGDRKTQHLIALCGKLALVEAMGLSCERIRNVDEDDDYDNDDRNTTMTGPVRNFKTKKYGIMVRAFSSVTLNCQLLADNCKNEAFHLATLMFQHLPCRNLWCFLLENPLVIDSISS